VGNTIHLRRTLEITAMSGKQWWKLFLDETKQNKRFSFKKCCNFKKEQASSQN
jgi:hypothetical protein